ncbi:hypothetical protein C5E45_31080 [Nocardia nova]|uniref:ABC transporter permease n=1 Tax=Nocardia nova TaxID=37330 RepID=A0A2S6AGT5_9NOCA|nr:DUF3533 domain-containing protein [Nocardia nova]PPJ21635.1 hypothetical protein C5E41_29420 [Nocardia nova]PPJ33965.1 hypothetical protein C5E45_31080 [Nocardia nova]
MTTNDRLARRRIVTGVLMLPLFFLIALPGLFLGLLHSPAPHEVEVAVIGTGPQAQTVANQLAAHAKGFEVQTLSDADAGRNAVQDREVRAAYDPATGDLYVASAGSVQATEAGRALFAAVAQAGGTALQVRDVVPLPTADRLGTSALYIGIGAIVGGFLSGLIVAMIAPGLRVRTQVSVVAVMSVVVAGIETFYGWVLFDIFPGNAAAGAAVLAGIALVAGVVTLAGTRLIGPAMVMVSILLLVLCGVTASGLPVPLDMAPAFYNWMHDVLPTARGLSALRSVCYFDGEGVGVDLLVMAAWGLAAMVVLAVTRKKVAVPGNGAFGNLGADEAVVAGAAASASA